MLRYSIYDPQRREDETKNHDGSEPLFNYERAYLQDQDTLVVCHRTDRALNFTVKLRRYQGVNEIEFFHLPRGMDISQSSKDDRYNYPDVVVTNVLRQEFERSKDMRPFIEISRLIGNKPMNIRNEEPSLVY